MTIDDEPGWDPTTRWWAKDVDKKLDGVLVVVNASDEATTQTVSSLAGHKLTLSPVQAKGSDPVVKGTDLGQGHGHGDGPAADGRGAGREPRRPGATATAGGTRSGAGGARTAADGTSRDGPVTSVAGPSRCPAR